MKKKNLAYFMGSLAMMMLVGCSGKISNDVITINQYKGLEVDKVEVVKVTDDDVENSIKSTLKTLSTKKEITDRAAKLGDVTTIDYVGKVDGVAFEGGTSDDYELELGSGTFIPGFEEQIVGHKVGEVFDINVTFPENYNEEMAGKDAVFTITLDKIQEVTIPELTDELVSTKLSTTAKTIEEYKAEERKNLELSNEQTAETKLSQSVWAKLVENCEVKKFPEDDMEDMLEQIEEQYSSFASMYGMDVDTVIQEMYKITKQEMAEQLLTQQYAIELIAKKEKITLTVKAYEEDLAEYANRYGYKPEEIEEIYEEEAGGREELEKMFLQERVGAWLIENCKQK